MTSRPEEPRVPGPIKPAIWTCAIFFLISWGTGDFFPFTQVPMYSGDGAGVRGVRDTAAIPTESAPRSGRFTGSQDHLPRT